jgi:hypothetical protein
MTKEYMKQYLKNIDFKIAMLLYLGLIGPLISPSIGMPVAIICFAGLFAMDKWMQDRNSKKDVSGDLEKEVQGIKNMMSGMIIKNSRKPEEASNELKRFF